MINLIGLYGPSRAGKDSVAKILVKDFEFQQRAQAAAIRQILLDLNPLIQDDEGNIHSMQGLYHDCYKDWDKVKAVSKESVDYMIRLGQSCRDRIDLDIWVNTAMPPIGSTEKIILSDIRQPNEYTALKERGGVIWHIIRPGVEKRGMDGLLDDYQFDAVLYNTGTLDDLRQMVLGTMKILTQIEEERIKNGR